MFVAAILPDSILPGSESRERTEGSLSWLRRKFRAAGGNISFVYFLHISLAAGRYFGKFLRSLNSCGSQSQVLSTSFLRDLHFSVARGKISIFAGHGGRLGAHSARFFKDLGFRALQSQNFCWPAGA